MTTVKTAVPPAARAAWLGISIVIVAAATAWIVMRGSDDASIAAAQPAGWDDELRMAEVADMNDHPHVLEFALEAKIQELGILPGVRTPAWTYNGTVPGPLIRARVGDRLIVHFTNSLPEPTTIHWHSLRVSNDMDGAPGVTQQPVPPGGRFRYDFVLKDAGTYWYHPHMSSAAQVGRGLYGAIVVEDPDEPIEVGDELVLVLSDMSIEPDGSLRPADQGGALGDLFGREGNVVLVNGKVAPALAVRAGKQQRWRVINAARSRYFSLRLRGHRWIRIGGDNGLAARSEELDTVLVTPGERSDLIFTPTGEPDSETTLYWSAVDRGFGTATNRARVPLLRIRSVDEPPVAPVSIPSRLREIEPIDVSDASEETVELTIRASAPPGEVMGINGVPHHHGIRARVGETQIWTIVNNTDFAHPFHLHGYFFQVLDDARVPEWKDTVNVPVGSRLRVAVRFDERPGAWMFHCHILDHADGGMMGLLHVEE